MTKRSRKQERILRWEVVLNTSVIVSAVMGGRVASQVLNLWKSGRIQIVLSDEIADEYLDVLARWVPATVLENWRLWFSHPAKVTHVHSYARRLMASRDVTDNKFVDTAVAGGARYVITRDNDLLALGEFQGIRFVGPDKFLTAFYAARGSWK